MSLEKEKKRAIIIVRRIAGKSYADEAVSAGLVADAYASTICRAFFSPIFVKAPMIAAKPAAKTESLECHMPLMVLPSHRSLPEC